MIEIFDIGIENAVAFRITGKIRKSDMTTIFEACKAKIAEHGDIVLLEKIESVGGIEISALLEEIKYLFELGLSNIKKVAVLTDKKWIEKVVVIENKFFPQIEIKCFAFEQQSAAVSFLKY
ncbi:MAG: STAS/SEC14 domain-containing protein [Pseudomonadales bacterium]|nr:STAS/SEC14 domain-containing protein [Pseudomonadales bacterium]NRA17735.1 STAS/SEC14 domain-containing protein [Oceanospirillaceae bacterium]